MVEEAVLVFHVHPQIFPVTTSVTTSVAPYFFITFSSIFCFILEVKESHSVFCFVALLSLKYSVPLQDLHKSGGKSDPPGTKALNKSSAFSMVLFPFPSHRIECSSMDAASTMLTVRMSLAKSSIIIFPLELALKGPFKSQEISKSSALDTQ